MSGKDRPLQQLSSNAISAKELARSLGLVKKTPSSSTSRKRGQEKEIKRRQHFTYLIVLDFESTCWKDKKLNYGPEIIEFPAVLLNTSTGELESEFQMFVQPSEHTKLSEFCRELTGITQAQVDDGIPIGTCLMLFGRWLQEMKDKKGFKFPCEQVQKKEQEKNTESLLKWCTFVTWSDWDLGTCLKNECYRKQLRMPHPLRSWIDLRATYKNFYSRKPQGLAGALQDLGIKFSGREHSGLDDARNTARLAWRMISDGCVMQITKTIDGMLEKLWTIVTQNGPSQSDSNKVSVTAHTNTSNNNFFKSSSESKNSAQAELTKLQIYKASTLTSERNVRESLNFSKLQAEDRVEREVIVGLGQQNIAVKNKFTGSGVDYPSDKMTIVKGKDHIVIMQRNEAKTDENRRAMAVVPGLKRRAPQGIGSLTSLSNVCSVSNTGCDYTPKSLITPSTSLPTVNKRARGCYGGLRNETPKSSAPGRIFKTGLAKQTLSNNMQCTPLGCNNRQMSLGVGHSESVTVNQPCKPSNIEPKAVTMPSLSVPVNKSSLTDKQQQKQVTRKDNLMKTLTATTAKNYPMHLNKPFTTPMGKPKPFTPLLVRTKPNSPATPPITCFNGGGVTPPLCQCGRRTRRRSVVNPGPNQGRAFFACSLNHGRSGLGANANNKTSKSGCGFFRWEIHL